MRRRFSCYLLLGCLILSPIDFLTLKMWILTTILPLLDTALHSNGLCYALGGHFVFGNILICPIYILRCLILSPMHSLILKMWNLTAILPILDTTLLSYSLLYAFWQPFCFWQHSYMSHLHSEVSDIVSNGFLDPENVEFDCNIAYLGHRIAKL